MGEYGQRIAAKARFGKDITGVVFKFHQTYLSLRENFHMVEFPRNPSLRI
jgi:hypothetical protein